jgi:hypothetical protein
MELYLIPVVTKVVHLTILQSGYDPPICSHGQFGIKVRHVLVVPLSPVLELRAHAWPIMGVRSASCDRFLEGREAFT